MVEQINQEPVLNFPLVCHYKVIARNLEHMHFVIETVLLQMGIRNPLEAGNVSANGNYITYNISVRVKSKDIMDKIDAELRSIEGVKMVL